MMSGRVIGWAPLGLLCVACAAAYWVLVAVFSESIDIELDLIRRFSFDHGGPTLLLMMVSGILGWFAVSAAEYATGTHGVALLVIVLPVCGVTMAAALATLWAAGMPFPTGCSELSVVNGAVVALAAGMRTYFAE
jgi:hypothetical protein